MTNRLTETIELLAERLLDRTIEAAKGCAPETLGAQPLDYLDYLDEGDLALIRTAQKIVQIRREKENRT